MKNLLNGLLFFYLLNTAAAQPFSLQLQQVGRISFQQPVFVGQTGNQYAIIDVPDASGTPLYLLSSSLQLMEEKRLPKAAYNGFRFSQEKRTGISWLERQRDTLWLKRVLLQQSGDPYPIQSVALPGLTGQAGILVNKTATAYFYYTLHADGKNHMLIRGSLVNDSLQIVENIDGVIDFDPALERFTGPALDADGNIHLVIYDRLSNYHESASIRINTIPYAKKEILEEIFHFDKVKLYDLLLFDNAETKQLQLTGFFYNGSSKTINGIAAIRFPYDRVNQVSHTFSRFSDEQRAYIAAGMENVRKHDDVFDFLKLRGIYRDGQNVLLSAWLLDIPKKKIVKDREYEQHQNTDNAFWIRTANFPDGPETATGGNAVSRMPSKQGAMVPLGGVDRSVNYSSWDNSSLYKLYVQPTTTYDKFDYLQRSTDRKLDPKNLAPAPLVSKPKKYIFFSIDANGKFEWMQAVPGEMQLQGISAHNVLTNHFFFGQEQWRLPFYETDKKTASPVMLNLLSIDRTGIQKEPLLNAKAGQFYFSGLWKISETEYISAFKDVVTGECGLATLATRKRDTAKQ